LRLFKTAVTRATCFIPNWYPMQRYVYCSVVDQVLREIVQPGVCREQGSGAWDNPFTIIFAPVFQKQLAKERPCAKRTKSTHRSSRNNAYSIISWNLNLRRTRPFIRPWIRRAIVVQHVRIRANPKRSFVDDGL